MIRLTLAILVASAPALAQTGAPSAAPGDGDRTAGGVPRGGVVAPPPTRPMPQAAVPAERPSTPVIPPPGTPGGDRSVQPR